jgi:NAD(P)-dependent dehydrogenase (short-subunit alcohol dehydrogenase family)
MQAQSRVAIVTGGGGGIGSAIADALLAAGHCVAAVDRNVNALDRLCARHHSKKTNDRLHAVAADVAAEGACGRAVGEIAERFGRIDALVNNAGIGMSSIRPDAETRHPTIEELSPEIWDRFFAVNVRAALLMTRAALPFMKRQKWGRIVNNTTSFRTMLRVLPYGATKSALESMAAVWAAELEGSGITVNVLIPGGPTDTPFIAQESGWPRETMLRPEIMGPPACWLLSEEANGFTGQRIIAARWDAALSSTAAAKAASRAIGWPELAGDAVWLQSKPA